MTGKVCVITGSTSGIGRATAVGLAKLGARVVVTGPTTGEVDAGIERTWAVPLMRGPSTGALTPIHLASAPELSQSTGEYFVDFRPRAASSKASREGVVDALWEHAKKVTGLG